MIDKRIQNNIKIFHLELMTNYWYRVSPFECYPWFNLPSNLSLDQYCGMWCRIFVTIKKHSYSICTYVRRSRLCTGCSLNIMFFSKILKYSGVLPFSVFPRCQYMCTHTRHVEHQRCSRTRRFQKNRKILRKNTIFNEQPVDKHCMKK